MSFILFFFFTKQFLENKYKWFSLVFKEKKIYILKKNTFKNNLLKQGFCFYF